MTASERFDFVGGTGQRLAGRLHRPDSAARGMVLFAHCFTCSQDLHTSTRLARGLVDAGYLVLTFDFTGLGRSAGDFADTSVSSNVSDLTRAAVALIERDVGPCVLLGHSLGGAAAVLAAQRLHTVEAVIAVASPASVGHLRHLIGPSYEADLAESGAALVSIGGRPFSITRSFLEDLEVHDVVGAARQLGRPFLVVEAGSDTVVGPEETSALAAAGEADLIVIEGADHLFSDRSHADLMVKHITGWLAGVL